MKKPEVSAYLAAFRAVAVHGDAAQGVGLVEQVKKLYKEDFKAFMERLHEFEKEYQKSLLAGHRTRSEAQSKPEPQPEVQAPSRAILRDLETDKVIAMCEELAGRCKPLS